MHLVPEAFDAYLERFSHFLAADGILVNSFAALEPAALKAIAAGLCGWPGRRMNPPAVHCIGPIISDREPAAAANYRRHRCLDWLDSQLEKSVVFLCFGSSAAHSGEQLTEIAVGVERSGQRFLWVVRDPGEKDRKPGAGEPPELEKLLPEGFVERNAGRGMVVASWVPQAEVLRHRATGGFVTHCGWNSGIEAVIAGVPMIGWPIYAEQGLNMVVMSEELRLAVPMKGYDEGVVTAAEVEEKMRWLMESEGGEEMRVRAAAVEAGGESYEELARVFRSIS